MIASTRECAIPVEKRRRRDRLELEVAALRDQKEKLAEDVYYARLETLMVELARIDREVPAVPTSGGERGHAH